MEMENDPASIDTNNLFKESYKGEIKSKYHFEKKLASGGFGIVYLATDRKTSAKFAIKAIQKKNVKDFHTFINEVKILQALVSLFFDMLNLKAYLYRIIQISLSCMKSGNGMTSVS